MAIPFDIANFNLTNFANDYNTIFDSTPADVNIQVKDSNGNITTKTVANRGKFQKQVWDDVGGALGSFNQTFYVNSIEGLDTNNGTKELPFKTLQKASDSIPTCGSGIIHIVADTHDTFSAHFKDIQIIIKDNLTWTIDMGKFVYCDGANLTILNNGSIVIDSGDESNINDGNRNGFLVNSNENISTLSKASSLYLINKSNNPINIGAGRGLIGPTTWTNAQNIGIHLAIFNIFTSGDAVIDGYLLRLNHGNGSFQHMIHGSGTSINYVDSSGEAVDINTKILGIIKDTNGVPRNIQSNIIF